MAVQATTAEKLMTVEEFATLENNDRQQELVRGKVVEMNLPKPKHGFICLEIGALLREFVKPRKLGRVFTNDSGVITERDPDSMRGPDVGFYSFARVPAGIPLYFSGTSVTVQIAAGQARSPSTVATGGVGRGLSSAKAWPPIW